MIRGYSVKLNSAVGGLLEALDDFGDAVRYITRTRNGQVKILLGAPERLIPEIDELVKFYE